MQKMQKEHIYIRNGQLYNNNANELMAADIEIKEGAVTAIKQREQHSSLTPPEEAAVIDATDCWILPSFIDLSHSIREPGLEQKGNIHSETFAAASAGFTHLVCPPTTKPIIDNPAVAKLVQNRAEQAGFCQILPLGAMTLELQGAQLSEMSALKKAGCVGVFTGTLATSDNRTLARCLEYASTFDLPVYFRPLDASLSEGGLMHDGLISHQLGIPGIPACAETIALARDLLLVAHTGIRAHFSKLSCAGSVEMIAAAKAKGLRVSCDVSLQHLLFNDESLSNFNALYLEQPPFRSESDRKALVESVASGVIDAICSNHQPHELAAKMAPLGECQAGLSTLDAFIPKCIRLLEEEDISLSTLVNCLSINPAQLLGLEPLGQISCHSSANLTVVNPHLNWLCDSKQRFSAGHNCAEQGKELTGKVVATVKSGKITYQSNR